MSVSERFIDAVTHFDYSDDSNSENTILRLKNNISVAQFFQELKILLPRNLSFFNFNNMKIHRIETDFSIESDDEDDLLIDTDEESEQIQFENTSTDFKDVILNREKSQEISRIVLFPLQLYTHSKNKFEFTFKKFTVFVSDETIYNFEEDSLDHKLTFSYNVNLLMNYSGKKFNISIHEFENYYFGEILDPISFNTNLSTFLQMFSIKSNLMASLIDKKTEVKPPQFKTNICYFKFVNDFSHLETEHLSFNGNLIFRFNDNLITLNSGWYSNDSLNLNGSIQGVSSDLRFNETYNSIDLIDSTVSHPNLKLKDSIFVKIGDDLLKNIPEMYQNKPATIKFFTSLSPTFEILFSTIHQISIDLLENSRLEFDSSGDISYFYENNERIESTFFRDSESIHSKSCTFIPKLPSQRIKKNGWKLNKPYMYDVQKLLNIEEFPFKSSVFYMTCQQLKLNEGFFELQGSYSPAVPMDKSFNCLLRIPLHSREIPELYIDNVIVYVKKELKDLQKIQKMAKFKLLENISIKIE
eukprot:gene3616-6432_t